MPPEGKQPPVLATVWATLSFSALHQWEVAPDEVEFLRHPHRHVFHVHISWVVNHDDRDIEFITKKRIVESYVMQKFGNKDLGNMSCEMIARDLLTTFGAAKVEVSEDDENGASLTNLEVLARAQQRVVEENIAGSRQQLS